MYVPRSSRSQSPRSSVLPAHLSCGTGAVTAGLRVTVFVVIVMVVVLLLKSGQSVLDALGVITVAAGAAVPIIAWLEQSSVPATARHA
ncbi:hypothetical protein [Streptomyces lavendofoliae]|uniref:Uncharacterized protein n=1 Tax=Streptomyces lavendofoliae TaxID=67314 RepID=A0A918I3F3_9ACTN|nr:hypothetical protein [Streptomyces lavendofoliae]GGU63695.1 hypothetical protein GCM10010274_60600 [Streptomyces lavendofoliae]